jgi:Uracil DNA glycosylase superfamily
VTWVPTRRPVAAPLAALWAQLYPCALARRCQRIQFDAEQGLLPRGIYAPPTLGQVRLLVLAHNPGDPQPGELAIFRSAAGGRDQVEVASALTYDSFVRALLPPAQRRRSPDHKPKRYHPRLLRVLMAALGDRQPLEPEAVLEQVVCSNLVKCQLLGAQAPTVTLTNCTSAYLQREFALLPAVPVLAVGSPAHRALEQLRRQGQLPDAHAVVAMRHPSIVFTDDHHASAVTALRRTLPPGAVL